MTHERIAQHEPAPTPEQDMLARIEEELHRLRTKRPALDGVIDRAAGIIVAHLSCRRQRVIGVRVGLGSRYKFVFRSLNERGATYVIDPSVWSCSCPAYHRTGGPCKHTLAAFVLYRAGMPAPKAKPCQGCGEVLPSRELREIHDRNHQTHWPGDMLCKPCAGRAGVQW